MPSSIPAQTRSPGLTKSRHTTRQQRPPTAALLAGYSDACYQRSNGVRQGNETLAVERALALSAAALGDAAVQVLRGQGAALGDAELAGWALAVQDLPAADAG